MMRKAWIVVWFILVLELAAACAYPWFAFAQQQPDPAALQRIIPSLQQQRNEAMDKAALAEARVTQLAEEVQKLKADLEKAKQAGNKPPD